MKRDAERVLQDVQRILEIASSNLVRDGHVYPIAFVWGQRDPRTGAIVRGQRVITPIVPDKFDGVDHKDGFAHAIRAVVRRTHGYAVFNCAEAWTLPADIEDPLAESRKYGQIANHPRRLEAVYGALEHEALPSPAWWQAPIHRDETGKPLPLQWVQLSDGKDSSKTIEGRFMRMLRQRDLSYS